MKLTATRLMPVAGISFTVILAASCTMLSKGSTIFPSPPPSPPCTIAVQTPAPMFAIDAPATASAGTPFNLVPWVILSAGSWNLIPDAIATSSFTAMVDDASKTITVTGLIDRVDINPAAACPAPELALRPKAATLSLQATASAGTYLIVIPPSEFSNQVPFGGTYPSPSATRSILVE